jgi:uncharacterized protein (TIGR03437 family)
VLVGGLEAEVVSAGGDEIRVLCPAALENRSRAALVVDAGGFLTSPEMVTVVPADPGLFPPDGGLAAKPGATVALRATGLGPVDASGSLKSKLTAKVGERDAEVEAVVPGADRGVFEIRIKLPADVTGEQAVSVEQNGLVSNPVTITIQP